METTTTITNLQEELIEEYGLEAVEAFIELYSLEDLHLFRDSYEGQWDNDQAFVKELLTNIDAIPDGIPAYVHIDWEWTTQEVMHDYTEGNGHYFRNI